MSIFMADVNANGADKAKPWARIVSGFIAYC